MFLPKGCSCPSGLSVWNLCADIFQKIHASAAIRDKNTIQLYSDIKHDKDAQNVDQLVLIGTKY